MLEITILIRVNYIFLVQSGGFEPPAFRTATERSNPLSYDCENGKSIPKVNIFEVQDRYQVNCASRQYRHFLLF
jgi:hypothetical protein